MSTAEVTTAAGAPSASAAPPARAGPTVSGTAAPDVRLTSAEQGAAFLGGAVERVLTAADELVAQTGVTEMTVTDLARLSGVRPGSIYQFFPTKTAVLDALAERYLIALDRQLAPQLGEPDRRPTPDLLEELFEAHVSYLREHPGFRALWLGRAHLTRLPRLDTERDAFLAGAIDRALQGQGADPERTAAAARLVVFVTGHILELAFQHDPAGDADVLAEGRRLLTAYITDITPQTGDGTPT
ncbi:TetR/AcrR family transcriptional regulator [Actinomadura formosensis]|uniref:TetR/AcrR family transcriptional regulator n=1 Tax=Actinomadura formosensis TaxID=60706 RepID=UPI000A04C31F|nr:TetR/AcrR family transcriptional regulator [Actinomadura formosensis]